MPKKNKGKAGSVEIIPLTREETNAKIQADFKSMVRGMIEQGVREALSGPGAELQPFFGTKQISYEIKRRQSVHEQSKFLYFFEDCGCMVCGSRDKAHHSCGMCQACYSRIGRRLRDAVRKREPPKGSTELTFMDTVRMAREALGPSVQALLADSARQALLDTPKSSTPHSSYRNQAEAAKEAGIHPKTLIVWLKSGKVQRPKTKLSENKWIWGDEDIERLKALKKGSAR